MTTRSLVAGVLTAGVAVGGATALLDRGDARPALAAPVAGVSRTAPQRVPIKPIGPVTIAARADDPGGATPWAVRRLTTRTRGQTYPCLQLGRLDGTRFGWIAPDQPFRLARFDLGDVPNLCDDRFFDGRPQLSAVTLTTDASSGLPEPDRTIVWGALPPDAASARLSDGTLLRPGAHGVVLAVLPGRPVGDQPLGGTLQTKVATTRRFPDPTTLREAGIARPGNEAVRRRLRALGSPITGALRIAARVPDPAGGAAWGIVTAPSTRDGVCFSTPGHVVGERLATVEPHLGIARPSPFGATDLACKNRRAPSAAHPLRMDVLVSSIPDTDPAGTAQLRRLDDRTVLHGRTTADVRAVTITTSRDVRTVVPDPRTHVFLAVYDGTFPGEPFRATATLRDGSRRTVVQASGG